MASTQIKPVSRKLVWTGRVLSALPVPLLFMSAFMKLSQNEEAVKGMAAAGYPAGVLVPLGVVEVICTILYCIPHTSVLGAILLTGYLGGAIDVHVRAGEPFFIPLVLGVIVWLGLYLRSERVRLSAQALS